MLTDGGEPHGKGAFLQVRIDPALKAQAEREASRRGSNLSHVVRVALAREIGRREGGDIPPPIVRTNPEPAAIGCDYSQLYALAAHGDGDAQSRIVDLLLAMPMQGVGTIEEAACAAEIPARISAMRGGDRERMRLAGVLLARAASCRTMRAEDRAAVYEVEAVDQLHELAEEGHTDAAATLVALLGKWADNGNEQAAERLNSLSDRFGPDVMRRAGEIDRFCAAGAEA